MAQEAAASRGKHAAVLSSAPTDNPFVVFVICGPSGVGKSTILKKLFEEHPGVFGFSVSREEDGREYHFVDVETMKANVAAGMFIESACFSGNLYGTSFSAVHDVLNRNLVCVLDIDAQGVRTIKKSSEISPTYVFVQPPSIEALKERLMKRGTETEQSLKLRLDTAVEEMKYSAEEGAFHAVLVNDNLDQAYAQLKAVLQERKLI